MNIKNDVFYGEKNMSVKITANAYDIVTVNGTKVSQHMVADEARESAFNEAEKDPKAKILIVPGIRRVEYSPLAVIDPPADPPIDPTDPPDPPIDPPIPPSTLNVEGWEQNMLVNGRKWGQFQNPNSGTGWATRFVNAYYDMLGTLYRIKAYTGSSEWDQYIEFAKHSYRNEFYRPDNYHSNGYYRFPHGLLADFQAGGDTTIEDIRMVRDNMAFSLLVEFEQSEYLGQSQHMSREMAYALAAHVCAERAGETRDEARVSAFVGWMANHLHEWYSNTFSTPGQSFFQPFMFALTAKSLIEFYEWEIENGRDPNAYWPTVNWTEMLDGIASVALWMFNEAAVREGPSAGQRMWAGDQHGFRYADREYEEGAGVVYPGLNLLIAPVYAWLYKETTNLDYANIGDLLFNEGVTYGSPDWSGKAFNQNYFWSFDYLAWR